MTYREKDEHVGGKHKIRSLGIDLTIGAKQSRSVELSVCWV